MKEKEKRSLFVKKKQEVHNYVRTVRRSYGYGKKSTAKC
jgi:hypothetical protein